MNDGEIAFSLASLCYILSAEHLWRSVHCQCGPLPTCVQTFRFVRSTYCSTTYKTVLTNQYWRCMPRKTSLNLVHYCTLLPMAHHFDVHNNNLASYFIIKQAVKLYGFTSKQYWRTTSLNTCKNWIFLWLLVKHYVSINLWLSIQL